MWNAKALENKPKVSHSKMQVSDYREWQVFENMLLAGFKYTKFCYSFFFFRCIKSIDIAISNLRQEMKMRSQKPSSLEKASFFKVARWIERTGSLLGWYRSIHGDTHHIYIICDGTSKVCHTIPLLSECHQDQCHYL